MANIQTRAGEIHVDIRGEGPTVVLLPSGAHDHHDYDELRARLSGVRTIAVDWPGHGHSPLASRAAASALAYADVAEDVVAQLAPEGAVVVGNSVGGFSAARLAIQRPELVRGLVIVDGGGFAGRPPQVRAFCWLMSRPWFLRHFYPFFSWLYMRSRTDADRRARATAIETTRTEDGLASVAGLWATFASPQHDLRGSIAAISAPTLVIWGKHDPVIPLRTGRWIADRIKGARLAIFEAGHVPITTDPDGVGAELNRFIAGLPAA